MILAGDIGGTKTVLALVDPIAGPAHPLREERFTSKEYDSLDAIIRQFLGDTRDRPTAASFGIAGRVAGRQCQATNLPWFIDADVISREFGIPEVHLLNDLQAVATAVPRLEAGDLCILNE
ncbi:MAG: glucokinase, partial [Rhodospirillales bacterium]